MSIQGCSRQSAVSIIDDIIKQQERKANTLRSLKEWMEKNPPPQEVEEQIWAFLTSGRAGFYQF